jgi:glutamate--cysteine ligase
MSEGAPGPDALPAFAAYGIEIEYMIVDREHLDVRPLAEALLALSAGAPASEVRRGTMGWSNEIVQHVVELKNNDPVPSLSGLAELFHAEVLAVDALLEPLGARLMPGAMHPWMDPHDETRLWTQDHAAIYRSYDRIFDCRRHGWANVQSVHLNLPFAGDDEFARLHAAVRLALPILPALAASSPWADGRRNAGLDHRLALYREHQHKIPSSMGRCIPEPSASPAQYRARVFAPMYRELAIYDALLGADAGVLAQEWLDARGAVPRFARSAIEIRVLDVQECPRADIAIAAATSALVRKLYEAHAPRPARALDTGALVAIFDACIVEADSARIVDRDYLGELGYPGSSCRAGELWRFLIDGFAREGLIAAEMLAPLRTILDHGTLARRIIRAVGDDRGRLHEVYGELCRCLYENALFVHGDP